MPLHLNSFPGPLLKPVSLVTFSATPPTLVHSLTPGETLCLFVWLVGFVVVSSRQDSSVALALLKLILRPGWP